MRTADLFRPAWNVSTVALLLSTFAAVQLLEDGCGGTGTKQEITLRDKTYVLKDPADSKPADLTGAELIGCSQREKALIAKFLGRVPAALKVTRIEVAWAQGPIAARVSVESGTVIFLVKQKDGSWAVKSTVLIRRVLSQEAAKQLKN